MDAEFRKDLVKVCLLPLLTLFLIPGLTLLFTHHAQPRIDARITDAVNASFVQEKVPEAERAPVLELLRAYPPSSTCRDDRAELASYRAQMCERYGELWQFDMADRIARWTCVAGAIVLVILLLLGGVAFMNRRAQLWSFLVGWRLLTGFSAFELVVQGALAIWLSFWITAHFTQHYFVKLVGVVALLALYAMYVAIAGLFRHPPAASEIDGEMVDETAAPRLWQRIRELAGRLGTAPPERLIAGIDTNFFVTEAPLVVSGRLLTGRTLFVSLPLLRVLDEHESDAVLAHELAHFRGGDTASSAALNPGLVRFEQYCEGLRQGGMAALMYFLLRLYRVIFAIALSRDSRAREFMADRAAAEAVSPAGIARSLVKIGAYAAYRGQVEQALFGHERTHDSKLGIAQAISAGLAPYAHSPAFAKAMQSVKVPHPFDSHPPMQERMAQVGAHAATLDFPRIVSTPPVATWAEDIRTAADIEARLWAAYEQRFAAVHEYSLAYRYLPANPQEAAVVAKYFPPVDFSLKRGDRLQINHSGILPPAGGALIRWQDIGDIKYSQGSFGTADTMELRDAQGPARKAKWTKLKLKGIGSERERLKAVMSRYMQRDIMARQRAAVG